MGGAGVREGDCLKRGLGQFADLRGDLARTRGGEGLIPPMHIMSP